jgi:hypothetical protein
MANKRLSKLKSSVLEPSEQDLTDEDGLELSLGGVLSLETEELEENMNNSVTNGKGT